jgi:hypothetical protein
MRNVSAPSVLLATAPLDPASLQAQPSLPAGRSQWPSAGRSGRPRSATHPRRQPVEIGIGQAQFGQVRGGVVEVFVVRPPPAVAVAMIRACASRSRSPRYCSWFGVDHIGQHILLPVPQSRNTMLWRASPGRPRKSVPARAGSRRSARRSAPPPGTPARRNGRPQRPGRAPGQGRAAPACRDGGWRTCRNCGASPAAAPPASRPPESPGSTEASRSRRPRDRSYRSPSSPFRSARHGAIPARAGKRNGVRCAEASVGFGVGCGHHRRGGVVRLGADDAARGDRLARRPRRGRMVRELRRYRRLGFPTHFRTGFEALELADPDTGWLWTMPTLTLESRALDPGHIHADWPAEQGLASPEERLTIEAAEMTSELDVKPRAGFALDAPTRCLPMSPSSATRAGG